MPPTPQPLDQDQTRCLIFGIDTQGVEHVYDRERERIVALDASGIDVQYALADVDGDKRDWMHYVAEKRGWMLEQWTGYKYAEALFGAVE